MHDFLHRWQERYIAAKTSLEDRQALVDEVCCTMLRRSGTNIVCSPLARCKTTVLS